MEKVRFGIIGVGNMGSGHSKNLLAGKVENGVLAAVCDLKQSKLDAIKALEGAENVATFTDYKEMLASGLIAVVIVAVPHYYHPPIVIDALNAGINAISEKPAGVYTKQVKEMNAVAEKSDKMFGMMFNQRTNCVYRKMREMVQNGELGEIKRVNWVITDWYRTQDYYDSGDWRATWKGEGGGVLLNQCPHNLDLWQWICGLPVKVKAFVHEGKWHDIEVEDDVTIYAEYANGATGTFITTSGDCPGTNRFEVTGTKGTLIFEDNKLFYKELKIDEREHCFKTDKGFEKPECLPTVEVELEGENSQHSGICNNIANAILGLEEVYAPAKDGICGVQLANAMLLSTWLDKEIELPFDDEMFYEELKKRIAVSKPRENVDDDYVTAQ